MDTLTLQLQLCFLATLAAGVAAAPGNTAAATFSCPAYRCGGEVSIHYPFWMDTDASGNGSIVEHCGYAGLRLECRPGATTSTPVLRLPSGEYAVTRILYGEKTVSVFDVRAATTGSCPRNVSLPAGSPLWLTRRNHNLTFLLGCSITATGIGSDHLFRCKQEDGQDNLSSYVFRDGRPPYDAARPGQCKHVVGMPVIDPADFDVGAALRSGFEFGWSPAAAGAQCGSCEKAGGLCGQRRDAARHGWSFTCFTRNDATPAPESPSGPFLTTRGIISFSLIGIILLLGGIALCLVHCGNWGEAPRRGHWQD